MLEDKKCSHFPVWYVFAKLQIAFLYDCFLLWETLPDFNGFLTSGRLAIKIVAVSRCTTWSLVNRSSSYFFPRELERFVRPRELVSFDPWHATRSPSIGKRIWVGVGEGGDNNGVSSYGTRLLGYSGLQDWVTLETCSQKMRFIVRSNWKTHFLATSLESYSVLKPRIS